MDQSLKYESIIITRPDINQEVQKNLHDTLLNMLDKCGGKEIRFENWGKRKLAYPIKKTPKGLYFYTIFLGNNRTVKEVERSLRMMDSILRIFTTKLTEQISEEDFQGAQESIFQADMEEELSATPAEFDESELNAEVQESKEDALDEKESVDKHDEN